MKNNENVYYTRPGISNSALGLINPEEGGSPKKYKLFIVDKRGVKEDSSSLKMGYYVHKYLENPEEFIVSDLGRPSDMMCSWIEEVYEKGDLKLKDITDKNNILKKLVVDSKGNRYDNTKKEDTIWNMFVKQGFDYLKFLIEGEEKLVIDSRTKIVLENIIISLKAHKTAWELLFAEGEMFGDTTHKELPIYWEAEMLGVKLACKSLLDRAIISPLNKTALIVDFKTTSSPVGMYKYSFMKYRTYRQMAFYKQALACYLKEQYPDINDWNIDVYIVAAETTGLFEVAVYGLSKQCLYEGQLEYEDLLKRITFHTLHDNWSKTMEELKQGYVTLDYTK